MFMAVGYLICLTFSPICLPYMYTHQNLQVEVWLQLQVLQSHKLTSVHIQLLEMLDLLILISPSLLNIELDAVYVHISPQSAWIQLLPE
jgi:hypothetical protein